MPVTAVTTEWARSLGLTVPVLNAPMGGAAGGRLAAAVSRAGGLGMIGMGSTGSAARLSGELRHLRGLDRPVGIGLVDWVLRAEPGLLDTALAARPALLAVSFGPPTDWVARAHDAGVRTATQVASAAEAEQAAAAGVDVLVARGAEGGGHGDPAVGTLPLLATVLDRVDVPVLAAGGISSARGLAAVLAAGAAGAWIGTLFAACPEALTGEPARRALLAAGETDTTTTDAFDRAHGYPWPARFPQRVLRPAALSGGDTAEVDAGQGVGLVASARPAGEVVRDLAEGAGRLLARWAPLS
ncbi:NAD(P)H-dependent flavin oxidoreductase [Blastococcus sp. SYSU D00695]